MAFKKVERVKFSEMEKDILDFWNKNKIFEKSIESRSKEKSFTFYDGPPYATGTPHYGNLLAGTIKDVIPRYKAMQGFRVERVWGWDTHGLPIENIIEKNLGFKNRDEIKEYGIDRFNEKCRTKVFEYVEAWKEVVYRTGRWADMENAYITMDKGYMESIWWVFSELWQKKLIYEDHKVMPYCPRCATGISSFEVGLGGYRNKIDKAITVEFELEDGSFLLAWTTTPWTLPGNLALAVGNDLDYVQVLVGKKMYILAKERLEGYKSELDGHKVVKTFKGSELVGKRYAPIFDYYKKSQKENIDKPKKEKKESFVVISGDFVSTNEGTGIVHIAPAFGEDDSRVAKEFNIGFFMPVDDLGTLTSDTDYSGLNVLDPSTNLKIIEDISGKIFKTEDYEHPYPYCWRCSSPLIFKAIDSWFLAISKIKEKMKENNAKVLWVPEFVGKGRYAKLIESAPDWNISRNRFWGVPIPVWKCSCGEDQVFGSVLELEKASGRKIDDIHLHKINDIKLDCVCGEKRLITGEILDVWFDSGSMPYARLHYPFENKERFEREFPADFIAEGIDQTRGWFNSLMVLGTALFGKSPFNSVVVNGTVLAEDGQKMSKSLKNFPDPLIVINKYGADAMRFYMMGSSAVKAEDFKFSEKGVDEVVKKINLTLWNSYSFFTMYALLDEFKPSGNLESKNVLDRWLMSITHLLIRDVTSSMERYEISHAARALTEYIDQLSNWYIRRSRKRFWKSEEDSDKASAYESLYFALTTYSKLLAPFMPFISEEIYRNLVVNIDKNAPESVHLSSWPAFEGSLIDESLLKEMDRVRDVIEAGLSKRNEAGVKVRQPLGLLTICSKESSLSKEMEEIILEEVNVKKIDFKFSEDFSVNLDTKITEDLWREGVSREFIRQVQDARKKAGFNVEDRIITVWSTKDKKTLSAIEKYSEHISKETLSVNFDFGTISGEYEERVALEGVEISITISRVKN